MAAMFADADLRMLNPWSIDGRYPADVDDATVAEARECIAAAERILDTATASLRRP